MSSSSPESESPRPSPAEQPGGRWTSPAGLQPASPPSSSKSATMPGRSSRRIAAMRAARPPPGSAVRSPIAAASSRAPLGSGSGLPEAAWQGHVPRPVGAWPGQCSIWPAFVTSCRPLCVQAAPANGPNSVAPSNAKGLASAATSPSSSSCGTSAPKPRGVRAATAPRLPALGSHKRCFGSKNAGHATFLGRRAGPMNAGESMVAGASSVASAGPTSRTAAMPGPDRPSAASMWSTSRPTEGRTLSNSRRAASGRLPYSSASRRWPLPWPASLASAAPEAAGGRAPEWCPPSSSAGRAMGGLKSS
mmetsp:Transcript_82791/g.234572  ORF Transcript_82791/g.234572 Transcript_82791/m.234572 type:complete len:305 (-) Transcript_82791:1651-2565(-)